MLRGLPLVNSARMNLSFRVVAVVCACLCLALALAWVLAPQWLLFLWGVEYSGPTRLVAWRSAALFAGLGIMFFMVRHAPPSQARFAMVCGFAFACFALALLGIFELVSGHAGVGILSAVVVEVVLGLVLAKAACGQASGESPAR